MSGLEINDKNEFTLFANVVINEQMETNFQKWTMFKEIFLTLKFSFKINLIRLNETTQTIEWQPKGINIT